MFFGGDGIDTVTYASRSGAVTADLDNVADDGTTADANGATRDNVRSDVENLIGGSGVDSLTGSALANRITSRDAVADNVTCLGAFDTVIGDPLDSIAADCESVTR